MSENEPLSPNESREFDQWIELRRDWWEEEPLSQLERADCDVLIEMYRSWWEGNGAGPAKPVLRATYFTTNAIKADDGGYSNLYGRTHFPERLKTENADDCIRQEEKLYHSAEELCRMIKDGKNEVTGYYCINLFPVTKEFLKCRADILKAFGDDVQAQKRITLICDIGLVKDIIEKQAIEQNSKKPDYLTYIYV